MRRAALGRGGRRTGHLPDGPAKRRWYAAEQGLRNQIDRTYEARMDFSLSELEAQVPGSGVREPPDTDTRAYLLAALHGGSRL